MQLSFLSVERMLVVSRFLLTDPDAQHVFMKHELGPPLRRQIESAHDDLSQLKKRRADARHMIGELSSSMVQLDVTHDRLARALNCHLTGLALASEDPEEAAFYDGLQGMLFSQGMGIVNSSYADEAGFATSVDRQITPELLARLASVQVGSRTLADILHGWLDAGMKLGDHVIERDRLQAAVSGRGPNADKLGIRQVRARWMRVMRTLLLAVEMMDLPDEQIKTLVQPLERMVARAQRERIEPAEDLDAEPAEDVDSDMAEDVDSEGVEPDGDSEAGPESAQDEDGARGDGGAGDSTEAEAADLAS